MEERDFDYTQLDYIDCMLEILRIQSPGCACAISYVPIPPIVKLGVFKLVPLQTLREAFKLDPPPLGLLPCFSFSSQESGCKCHLINLPLAKIKNGFVKPSVQSRIPLPSFL